MPKSKNNRKIKKLNYKKLYNDYDKKLAEAFNALILIKEWCKNPFHNAECINQIGQLSERTLDNIKKNKEQLLRMYY